MMYTGSATFPRQIEQITPQATSGLNGPLPYPKSKLVCPFVLFAACSPSTNTSFKKPQRQEARVTIIKPIAPANQSNASDRIFCLRS
jgi:hypothetical protein